jgi:ribosomal protein S18 acetylase RimI-like enzyme
MVLSIAGKKDIDGLVSLLNSAYRGEASKKGWTTEAGLLKGEARTDATTLKDLLQTPGAIFLKYINTQNDIEGCVFLHKKDHKLYLGMLSVSPLIQAKGIGKQLMIAAEKYAKENNCSSIFMKVISARHELIAWYERQGYQRTGETEPFPSDNRFGVPVQPLEFIILEKIMA